MKSIDLTIITVIIHKHYMYTSIPIKHQPEPYNISPDGAILFDVDADSVSAC